MEIKFKIFTDGHENLNEEKNLGLGVYFKL